LRIKKVKVTSENKIAMIYEDKNSNGTWDEYSFTCSDGARPTFYTALQDLSKHVIEMCELPVDYQSKIKVRGVSVSYGGEKEVMGATITAQMKLNNSNCDLNPNTPHKASDSYSDTPADDKQLLTDNCIGDLKTVYEECKAYISGDRAQGKLFMAS
jgi:hypothetical protein